MGQVLSEPTTEQLVKALTDAGIEVYRTTDQAIEIAERVRYHIMDSGVRVTLSPLCVAFTVRSQKSDFPKASEDELFDKVREGAGQEAKERGYGEARAEVVSVKDPVDDTKVLDVWHELSFERSVTSADQAVDEVRWALGVDKYVTG